MQLIPMRLRPDRRFLQLLTSMKGFDIKVAYDGSVREEKIFMGEENLLVRTINCDPDSYAWVEFSKEIHPFVGRKLPKSWGTCYAFSVTSEGAAQSQVIQPQPQSQVEPKTSTGSFSLDEEVPSSAPRATNFYTPYSTRRASTPGGLGWAVAMDLRTGYPGRTSWGPCH